MPPADFDIFVARSTDNGATWTDPIPLNTNAATDSGFDGSVQVATDGAGHWVAVWGSQDTLGGTIEDDWDVLVARSTDNGATWTDPVPLDSNAFSDGLFDGPPYIATDGSGLWLAVWYVDDDLLDADIVVARSTDNGATWTAPTPLNITGGSGLTIRIAVDRFGNWVAVWESGDDLLGTIGFDWDILVARSSNGGVTWTDPIALNGDAADDIFADNRPQIATNRNGQWVVVWHIQNPKDFRTRVRVSRSSDNGASWTDPELLDRRSGVDPDSEFNPQIASDGLAGWIAVWESTDDLDGTIGTDKDLLVSRSGDNGATWTTPVPFNTNAAMEGSFELKPAIATDRLGNWVGVWYSLNTFGDARDRDFDINVARFAMGICGDGVVEPPEECDDGNLEDGDGCSPTCRVGPVIPTVSEWGIAVMTLALITAGTVLAQQVSRNGEVCQRVKEG